MAQKLRGMLAYAVTICDSKDVRKDRRIVARDVVELARKLGSRAETKAGAWAFLRRRFENMPSIFDVKSRSRMTKQEYEKLKEQQRRIEKARRANRKIPVFLRYYLANLAVEDEITKASWEYKAWPRIPSSCWLCKEIAKLAFNVAPWGRKRKRFEGDNRLPCIRTEDNGKWGWDRVVWHYADYLAVYSTRNPRKFFVALPNGERLYGTLAYSGRTAKLGKYILRAPAECAPIPYIRLKCAFRSRKVETLDYVTPIPTPSPQTLEMISRLLNLQPKQLGTGRVLYGHSYGASLVTKTAIYECNPSPPQMYMRIRLSIANHRVQFSLWVGSKPPRKRTAQPIIPLKLLVEIPNNEARAAVLALLGKEYFEREFGDVQLNERGRALVRLRHILPVDALVVECPSTKRRSVLFVPPNCVDEEHAAAWSFGLSREEWAKLTIET